MSAGHPAAPSLARIDETVTSIVLSLLDVAVTLAADVTPSTIGAVSA